MRVCKERATGNLLEMQSSATEGTLIRNAVAVGWRAEDVEELEVSNSEAKRLMAIQIASEAVIDPDIAAFDAATNDDKLRILARRMGLV